MAHQESLGVRLEEHHASLSAKQATIIDKLDVLNLALCDGRSNDVRIKSDTVIAAPTEDRLARIFRAELRRVIAPTVKECFSTFKADPNNQVDNILSKIDQMASQFEGGLSENTRGSLRASDSGPRGECDPESLWDEPRAIDPNRLATVVNNTSLPQDISKRPPVRIKHYRRSWIFRWTIGTLWVTASQIKTIRSTSNGVVVGEIPKPTISYQV